MHALRHGSAGELVSLGPMSEDEPSPQADDMEILPGLRRVVSSGSCLELLGVGWPGWHVLTEIHLWLACSCQEIVGIWERHPTWRRSGGTLIRWCWVTGSSFCPRLGPRAQIARCAR
eukprot:COSAG01_NODE_8502_length_2761_cov_11.025175_5_plen_117_part_00